MPGGSISPPDEVDVFAGGALRPEPYRPRFSAVPQVTGAVLPSPAVPSSRMSESLQRQSLLRHPLCVLAVEYEVDLLATDARSASVILCVFLALSPKLARQSQHGSGIGPLVLLQVRSCETLEPLSPERKGRLLAIVFG